MAHAKAEAGGAYGEQWGALRACTESDDRLQPLPVRTELVEVSSGLTAPHPELAVALLSFASECFIHRNETLLVCA